MNTAFLNVLYLLWQADKDPDRWPSLLARWAGIGQREAEPILEGDKVRDDILDKVAAANRIEAEVLRYDLLVGAEEIVRENVRYLLSKLEHGQGKELAEHTQVAPETVSKWKQGEQIPTPRHRQEIKEYLGVERSVDLKEVPLFLLRDSLTDKMRRADLRDQIDAADKETIRKYYDAIKKLLQG